MGRALCLCLSLPVLGSLLHQGDFYPPSILRNHLNTGSAVVVAGGTRTGSSQLAEIFPKDKPCARRDKWP